VLLIALPGFKHILQHQSREAPGGCVRLHDLFDNIHNKRELDYEKIFILVLLNIKRVRSGDDTAYQRSTLGFLRKRNMRLRN
jgi:hypothetical protein